MSRARLWGWLLLLSPALLSAAAPPPPDSPEVRRLIKLLQDEDRDTRLEAAKKLEALDEEAFAALRRTASSHPDIDVRLRAAVIARAIEDRHWGELKVFGPGAKANLGYWLNRVAFSPDGKHAVVGGGALILFDLHSGDELRRVLEVNGARPALAISPDGKHCLTGHANDRFFHLVELPSLKVVRTFSGHTSGVLSVALSPDGKLAASVSSDISVRLWDVESGKELRQLVLPGTGPLCVAFAPDGKRLLVGYHGTAGQETVRLVDVETFKVVRGFTGHAGNLTRVAFLPGGTKGLSASLDGTLRLWDLETGTELLKMTHPGGPYDVAVSPDGRRALSAGFGDHKVRLWDLQNGKLIHVFEGHRSHVLGVAFSTDGRQALSSDAGTCVRLWKVGP